MTPTTVAGKQPSFDAREYEFYRRSRLELIRREHVLAAAIRDPDVGSLPIVEQKADPIEWLQRNLEIEDSLNSEFVLLQLRGDARNKDQLVKLLDAVAHSLVREIATLDRQKQRELQETMIRQANELKERIARRSDQNMETQGSKQSSNAVVSSLDNEETEVLRQQRLRLLQKIQEHEANMAGGDRVRILQPAIARVD